MQNVYIIPQKWKVVDFVRPSSDAVIHMSWIEFYFRLVELIQMPYFTWAESDVNNSKLHTSVNPGNKIQHECQNQFTA